MTVRFELTAAPTDTARALIDELETFLRAPGHDPAQHHGYPLEKIFRPQMRFFVIYQDDAAIGCCGLELQDGAAELKRMYLRPAHRGSGISRMMIAHLEAVARAHGARVARLETGDFLVRARAVYVREGYRECAPFPPYAELPPYNIAHSVFMEKAL